MRSPTRSRVSAADQVLTEEQDALPSKGAPGGTLSPHLRPRCVLDPSHKIMQRWDLVMVVALGFTASITPVEVGFLQEGEYITTLWMVNRIVDICFVLDMVFSFNLAYQEPPERGGHMVYSHRLIARRYLLGWFTIDLFSVLPFFLITLNWQDPFGNGPSLPDLNVSSLEDAAGRSSATRSVVLVRLVKMLRMLKLTRIFKASRVIERNLLDIALHKWEMTFAILKMLKLLVLLIFFAHLQARGPPCPPPAL